MGFNWAAIINYLQIELLVSFFLLYYIRRSHHTHRLNCQSNLSAGTHPRTTNTLSKRRKLGNSIKKHSTLYCYIASAQTKLDLLICGHKASGKCNVSLRQ